MPDHCSEHETQRAPVNCADHSGMQVWMKGISAGITICAGLLGYSVFWQAPTIRSEVAKEISRLDKQDAESANGAQNLRRDLSDMGRRVTTLEAIGNR